jgi:DNA-directed RNA polymerase sigma subunit (sigma70/sigma32)
MVCTSNELVGRRRPALERHVLDRFASPADTRDMEDSEERELDALLEQLDAEERDISAVRRKLHDRMATFSGVGVPHLETR